MNDTHRIVIIGSGFGGVYAYEELTHLVKNQGNIEITIISPTGHFVFSPLLHEVATGNLPLTSIVTPIHSLQTSLLHRMVIGTATGIDLDSQIVSVDLADNNSGDEDSIPYDSLIIAVGTQTNFFGTSGAQENSYVLKSLADARRIKEKVISLFENIGSYEITEDTVNSLRIVIVGGGPTGVELAGELSDMMSIELQTLSPYASHNASIVIVDATKSVLNILDPWFQRHAERLLMKKGNISILTGNPVQAVHHNGIVVNDTFIPAGMVIWTGGVIGNTLHLNHTKPVDVDERSGRISVTETLQLASYPSVFVVGDKALLIDSSTQKPYPQRAQFALLQGKCAARNIIASLREQELEVFKGEDKGIIISMGSGSALAQVFGIHVKGPLAWFIYRTVYLFKLFGWRNRIRTGVEWALNLFTPRDIARDGTE